MARSDLKDSHGHPPGNGERRHTERRVEELERNFMHIQQAVQRIEISQNHAKEVLDSRYKALEKGQDVVLAKIDAFDRQMTAMAGDPNQSPAGRQLGSDLIRHQKLLDDYDHRIEMIEKFQERIGGGLTLAQWLGAGGIVTALTTLGLVILRHGFGGL